MNRRSLRRKSVIWAAALALVSTVTGMGVPIQSALAVTAPACPSTAPTKEWPNPGGPYRGVVLCSGVYQGDDFFVQILSLEHGATMRVVSHVTDGSTPGNAETRFDKLVASQWYSSMGSYNSAPGTADLFSVTNAGFFADGDATTVRMSFPEKKSGTVTSLGAAFNGGNGASDWDAAKAVLKLSAVPGIRQTASIAPIGPHYTFTEFNTAASPSGIAYDAVVGFAPLEAVPEERRRTYVGTSNDNKTVFIIATEDWMTPAQIVNLYGTMGVNSDHLVQLDGGGSTQMTTKDGKSITSNACPVIPCERPVPEVLAVYEGTPPPPEHGFTLADLNHDGRADILARAADGKMYRYLNSGNNGSPYPSGVLIGPGWDQFSWWGADDVDGDGWDDIVARQFDGTLLLYRNNHNMSAPFTTVAVIGGGWQIYKYITIGNVNPGDNHADIIGMKPDGTLWRYMNSGNVNSPYGSGAQISSNWQANNRLRLGDINHDGKDDLIATTPDGTLWSLVNTMTCPSGAFSTSVPRAIGGGWDTISRFAMDDVTGDGVEDILGTNWPGVLYRYTNTWPIVGGEPFQNPFQAPVQVGQGWVESGWY